jgi:hypothetical protein
MKFATKLPCSLKKFWFKTIKIHNNMKALFYLSLIILVVASSCTINLYTTGSYDDVYSSPDEVSAPASTNKSSSVDEHKATYEETFNNEFAEKSNSNYSDNYQTDGNYEEYSDYATESYYDESGNYVENNYYYGDYYEDDDFGGYSYYFSNFGHYYYPYYYYDPYCYGIGVGVITVTIGV